MSGGMRLGHVPLTERGSLVEVATEMHAQLRLDEALGKAELGGRAVHRVRAHHHEQRHLAGIERGTELGQALRFGRALQHRLDEVDGLAEPAERHVHRVREAVHDRRLVLAGDDERALTRLFEIGHDGVHDGIADGG
jgi:hypothetical protein